MLCVLTGCVCVDRMCVCCVLCVLTGCVYMCVCLCVVSGNHQRIDCIYVSVYMYPYLCIISPPVRPFYWLRCHALEPLFVSQVDLVQKSRVEVAISFFITMGGR